ncbi:MAG: response regulator [Fibrobacteres bacterium]|nr:response regulator [Fibrobacterota bacterium]
MHRILIVDDEPSIKELLKEFLSGEGYTTETASDGIDALDILKSDANFDLIISDINMPRMKGFELLKQVEILYPRIKRVLLTAYSVEDYIHLALEHGISNIITKTTPFNFDELLTIVSKLLSGNILGLDVHLDSGTEISRFQIKDPRLIPEYASAPIKALKMPRLNRNFEMVMVELLNNAVYYGVKDMDPERKETWTDDFLLDDGQVEVFYGSDSQKAAIAVRDNGGKLSKDKIMYWLSRQMLRDETGLPVGLYDIHGRGLFISREYVDRLVVNLIKGKSTEIICLIYHEDIYKGHKPLLINEI